MSRCFLGLLILLVPGIGQFFQRRAPLGWCFLSAFLCLIGLGFLGYLTRWSQYLWALLATATAALYWLGGADFGRHHSFVRRGDTLSTSSRTSIQTGRYTDTVNPRT